VNWDPIVRIVIILVDTTANKCFLELVAHYNRHQKSEIKLNDKIHQPISIDQVEDAFKNEHFTYYLNMFSPHHHSTSNTKPMMTTEALQEMHIRSASALLA
jgi:hypothetical protein